MLQPFRRMCSSVICSPTINFRILRPTLAGSISQKRDSHSQKADPDDHLVNKSTKDTPTTPATSEDVTVTFVKPDGKKITVKTTEGKSLYDVVVDNNVDIDGFGACNGTLCCTTCQLIFKQADYEKVGEPREEELDMLDLAYVLSPTSRLGCQVILKKELDPLEVEIPASINDVREA